MLTQSAGGNTEPNFEYDPTDKLLSHSAFRQFNKIIAVQCSEIVVTLHIKCEVTFTLETFRASNSRSLPKIPNSSTFGAENNRNDYRYTFSGLATVRLNVCFAERLD